MKGLCLLALLLLAASTSAHAGKIYKWTDDNGQVHYSTFPPAKAETEKLRVPSISESPNEPSSTGKYKKSYKRDKYSRNAQERNKLREERKKKQAAEAYERKYGAEARLERLEQEKHQKKMRSERIRQERIRKLEQAEKDKEFEKKWKKFEGKITGLEDECKASHGTDCGNPEYLNKWVKKKYAPKK